MELFDKLGDTIVSVSKDATQKAKDISELARIRMEMRAKKDYINKLYLEIGESYFELHKDDENREFNEHIELIKETKESIEELKRQSGQIKGTIKCEICGHEMPFDADYCSKCGTKLVKPQPQKEDDDMIFEDEEEEAAEAEETVQNEDDTAEAVTDDISEEIKEEESSEEKSL